MLLSHLVGGAAAFGSGPGCAARWRTGRAAVGAAGQAGQDAVAAGEVAGDRFALAAAGPTSTPAGNSWSQPQVTFVLRRPASRTLRRLECAPAGYGQGMPAGCRQSVLGWASSGVGGQARARTGSVGADLGEARLALWITLL